MTRVLVTGAAGNVGLEVIKSLQQIDHNLDLFAGVRDLITDKVKLSQYNVALLQFDFTEIDTHDTALNNFDIVFLLRPPQISDVEKYFKPLIDICSKKGVKHIVFLSVQGVEKSKIIPHYKIEKLIVDSKINYTFLRPAYFMQNFTTTLRNELVTRRRIYLPAGNAKFTLVDVRDVGAVAAAILANISQHINKSYELTCKEKFSFHEMAQVLSGILGIEIEFKSPNLLSFFLAKRKENTATTLILVMIMLHYFPRFQKEPETTNSIEQILKRAPICFGQFINDNRKLLTE
ncbi:MAG: NmrA family NAD(P)-binding protein [Chitinophagaceae bacterium]|nr:NmrA family NAD(P)-binding protein [Chitinophagaceae bacterium]